MNSIDDFYKPGHYFDYNALARAKQASYVRDALYEEGVNVDERGDILDEMIDQGIEQCGEDARPSTVAKWIIKEYSLPTEEECLPNE
jgi:hypothetical protein